MIKQALLYVTLFTCTITSTEVFGQFSRSFYSAPSATHHNTGAFVYNNKINSVSVKESNEDSLKIMVVELTDRGITSNYRFLSTPLALCSDHMISGNAVSGNKLLLLIPNINNAIGKLTFVQIDLVSNTISGINTLPDEFIRGFVESVQKQDSLITYAAKTDGSIIRLATAISNPANIEIENTNLTYSGGSSYLNIRDYSALLIDGSNEYFNFHNQLMKRNSLGFYSSVSVPGTTNYSRDIVKNNNNEIILLNSNSLFRFTESLTLIDQRQVVTGTGFFSFTYHNGQNIVSYLKNGSFYTKYLINDDLSTLDSLKIEGHFDIYGNCKFNSSNYLYGSKREPVTLNTLPHGELSATINSSFIIKDFNNIHIPTFEEFTQRLNFHDFQFETGHLNSMFMNENTSTAQFKLGLNGLHRGLIFTAQNLVVGVDPNNNSVGIADSYYASSPESMNTLLTGPFTPTSLNSHENSDQYNKGFYVDRWMIDHHANAIENNDPFYVMPFGIEFWPGNGDPLLGQADKLAGFHDENGNDIYEPLLGDYPEIFGDRCFLNIYHQPEGSEHSNNLEIHQYYFMFDCDTNLANKHSFFVKQKTINRSTSNMDSVFVGSFIDFDIGSYSDDYVGTNVELGMIYGYNGDSFDQTDGGVVGFQDSIPAVGMMILQGLKMSTDGIDNAVGGALGQSPNGLGFGDGTVDNEFYGLTNSISFNSTNAFPYTDPGNFNQFYYSIQGTYLNGSYNQANGVDVRHAYFGNSDPYFYSSSGQDHGNNNSEITANNPPGDRRMIGGSGPGQLDAGDTVELLIAYVYGIDSTAFTFPNGVQNLFEHGTSIKNAYLNNSLGCGSGFDPYIAGLEVVEEEDNISIYPNPFNSSIKIDGLTADAVITICDMNGKMLFENQIENNQTIQLDWLTKNVYVIRIIDGDKIITKRIVKM